MKAAAGFGLREDQIVQLVLNPATGKPISPVTLRAHFRAELDSGHATATAAVASSLYKNATTATDSYPGGIPVAQIFWMKTRAGWREARPGDMPIGTPARPDGDAEAPADTLTLARRLAFALAMGAREAEAAPLPKPTRKTMA